jgi:hypothetical protein
MIGREPVEREAQQMTSGQGQYPGSEGQPGGPPQNWGAPPPQQPYGQPYPGYTPAPSAPTGFGAPQALERPTTVRAGIGAFVANLILGVIAAMLTFTDLDDIVEQELARSSPDIEVTEEVIRATLLITSVVTLVFVALQVLFIWFAWKGYNWARIVLWILGGLAVAGGLGGLGAGAGTSGFLTSLSVFQLLLVLAGIVLLALKPSNEWYRYRSWQRANGQG